MQVRALFVSQHLESGMTKILALTAGSVIIIISNLLRKVRYDYLFAMEECVMIPSLQLRVRYDSLFAAAPYSFFEPAKLEYLSGMMRAQHHATAAPHPDASRGHFNRLRFPSSDCFLLEIQL